MGRGADHKRRQPRLRLCVEVGTRYVPDCTRSLQLLRIRCQFLRRFPGTDPGGKQSFQQFRRLLQLGRDVPPSPAISHPPLQIGRADYHRGGSNC